MSLKPDFTTMTPSELRAYVLEHREDEEALQVYLDKCRTENPNSRTYSAEENVADAIAEYLDNKQKKAS